VTFHVSIDYAVRPAHSADARPVRTQMPIGTGPSPAFVTETKQIITATVTAPSARAAIDAVIEGSGYRGHDEDILSVHCYTTDHSVHAPHPDTADAPAPGGSGTGVADRGHTGDADGPARDRGEAS
jgi:hypothetical protein